MTRQPFNMTVVRSPSAPRSSTPSTPGVLCLAVGFSVKVFHYNTYAPAAAAAPAPAAAAADGGGVSAARRSAAAVANLNPTATGKRHCPGRQR